MLEPSAIEHITPKVYNDPVITEPAEQIVLPANRDPKLSVEHAEEHYYSKTQSTPNATPNTINEAIMQPNIDIIDNVNYSN